MIPKIEKKQIVTIVIALLIGLISFFGVAKPLSSPEFHKETIESLDEKKETVMKLTAASTAASVTISMLPGDMGTSLSNKLMDLSGYFLIVLSALYVEKYLLSITAMAAFKVLIPLACALFVVGMFWNGAVLKNMAKRFAVFGLAIFLAIPTSMEVSGLIERTYEASIEQALESAEKTTKEIEGTAEENEGLFKKMISKIKGGFTKIVDKMENVLNNFIEALAVMLVTSCVIPILVLFFFVWLAKVILGVNINISNKAIPKLSNKLQKKDKTDVCI